MPNCEKGDLATIVRNTTGECMLKGAQGRMVRVTTVYFTDPTYGVVWCIEQPLYCSGCGLSINRLLDADLQPIRGTKAPEAIDVPNVVDKTLEPA